MKIEVRNLFILLVACLGCSGAGSNSPTAPMTDADASNVMNLILNANSNSSPQKSANVDVGTCMTTNAINGTDADHDGIPVDVIYNFNCTNMSGTMEIKDLNDNDPNSAYQTTLTNFQTSNPATCVSTLTNSTLILSKGPNGSTTFNLTTDNKATLNNVSYEMKGAMTETSAPEDAANPQNGGTISLSGQFDFWKSGLNLGHFTVSETGVHYSACGVDRGTLEIKGAGHDFIASATGCGKMTMTDNNLPVTLPPDPRCQ